MNVNNNFFNVGPRSTNDLEIAPNSLARLTPSTPSTDGTDACPNSSVSLPNQWQVDAEAYCLYREDSALFEEATCLQTLTVIFGDSYISGTGYKGGSDVATLNLFAAFLKRVAHHQSPHINRNIRKKLQKILKVVEKTSSDALSLQISGSDISAQVAALVAVIRRELDSEGICLLRGGWVAERRGHSVYYEITKQPNGYFNFRCYNRGAGANYHDEPSWDTQIYFPAYYEIKDISEENIFNELFWRGLVEFKTIGKKAGADDAYNENELYQLFFPMLKGKVDTVSKDFEELLSGQHSGTCSWKSFICYLRTYLDLGEYKCIKTLFQQYLFWNYTLHCYEATLADPTASANYQKLGEAFANTLRYANQIQLVRKENYNRQLGALDSLQQQITVDLARRGELSAKDSSLLLKGKVETKLYSTEMPWLDVFRSSTDNVDKDTEDLDDPLQMYSVHAFTASNIMAKASFLFQHLRSCTFNKENDSAVRRAQSFIRALPLPCMEKNEDNLWQQQLKQEGGNPEPLYLELYNILEEYVFHLHLSEEAHEWVMDPTVIVDVYRLYSILDNLLWHADPSKTRMLGINVLHDYRVLSSFFEKPVRSSHWENRGYRTQKSRHLNFQIKSPEQAEIFEQIYQYLESRAAATGSGRTQSFAFQGRYSRQSFWSSDTTLWPDDLQNPELINPEFDFFLRILSNPMELKKFFNSELSSALPVIKKLQILFGEDDKIRDYSPIYFRWRKLFGLMQYVLTVPLFAGRDIRTQPHHRFFQGTQQFDPRCGSVRNSMSFFCELAVGEYLRALPDCHREYLENKENKDTFGDVRVSSIRRFEANYLPVKDQTVSTVLSILKETRDLTENEAILYRTKGLNVGKMFHSLLLLGTNKTLQIDRLLAFYSQHLALLHDQSHRQFFDYLFYERNVLRDTLMQRPEFYQEILKFIDRGLKAGEQLLNASLTAFYLRLAHQTEEVIAHLKKTKMNEEWTQRTRGVLEPLNGFVWMRKLLAEKTLSTEEKGILYSVYLETALTTVWKQPTEHFWFCVEAIGFCALFPIPQGNEEPMHRLERKTTIKNIAYKCAELAKEQPTLFSKYLLASDPELMELALRNEWIVDGKQVSTSDRKITLNAYYGTLILRDGKRVLFPQQLVRALPYGLYPAGAPVYSKGEGCFVFYDKGEQKIELAYDQQTLEMTHLARTTQEGDRLELVNTPYAYLPMPSTHLNIWYNRACKQLWFCKDAMEGHQLVYILHEEYGTSDEPQQMLERVPIEEGGESLFVYTFKDTIPFNIKDVVLFCDAEGNPKRLEFYSMPLAFVAVRGVDGEERWQRADQPDLFLASSQSIALFDRASLSNYIVLENNQGQQEVHFLHKGSVCRIPFMLDSARQFRVLRPAGESALALAEVMLKSTAFEACEVAWECLRPEIALKLRMSEIQRGCLLNMASPDEYSKNNDVRIIACRLQAAIYYLASLDEKRKEASKKSGCSQFNKALSSDLCDYNRKRKRVGSYAIDEREEFKLISYIFDVYLEQQSQEKELDDEYLYVAYDLILRAKTLQEQFPDEEAPNYPAIGSGYGGEFIKETFSLEGSRDGLRRKLLDSLADPTPLLSYTRPHNELTRYFLHLLPDALITSERNPRKKNVRAILNMSRMSKNKETQFFRTVLKMICDNPKKYQKLTQYPSHLTAKAYSELLMNLVFDPIDRMQENEKKMRRELDAVFTNPPMGKRESPKFIAPYQALRGRGTRYLQSLLPYHRGTADLGQEIISIKSFIIEQPIQTEDVAHEYAKSALVRIFDKGKKARGKVGLGATEYRRMRQDVDVYDKQIRSRERVRMTLDDDKLDQCLEQLSVTVALRQRKGREQIDSLLHEVNKGHYYPGNPQEFIAEKVNGAQPFYTFQDLLLLHGRKEHALLTCGDEELAGALFESIASCLTYQLETQRYERARTLIAESLKNPPCSNERAALKAQACDLLINHCCYDPDLEPEKQVIEFAFNITLRKEQVDALNELRKEQEDVLNELLKGGCKPGLVKQAIPGFGKTTIIIPLFLLLVANGRQLSVCIVPDQMLEWIGEELMTRLGPCFGTWLRLFEVEAGKNYSILDYERMERHLRQLTENKHVMIIGAKSAHSLVIQGDRAIVEYCRTRGDQREEANDKLDVIMDIREHFEESKALGDEADIWLNTRREFNLSGGTQVPLGEEEQLALVCLYDALLVDSKVADSITFDFQNREYQEGLEPYSSKVYELHIKDRMLASILKKLESEPLWNTPIADHLYRLFCSFTLDEKKLVHLFLANDASHPRYVEAVEWCNRVNDPALANFLYLIAEELSRLLPSTLQRKCDEGYGMHQRQGIPARNGLLLIGSEFGNPHETANYTIQSLIKHGICPDLIKKRLDELQVSCLDELKNGIDLEETQGIRSFRSMCPGNAKRALFRLTGQLIHEIAEEVNRSQETRRDFILRYYLPHITLFSGRFNSNAFRLVRLMPQMRAVTGTLPQNYAYSELLEIKPNPGTDSRTLFILFRHCVKKHAQEVIFENNVVHPLNETPNELKKVIEEQLQAGKKIRLITDAAGYLNGCSGQQLSTDWLGMCSHYGIQAIGYHADGKPVVNASKREPRVPLNTCSIKPERRMTILFQPYTTGTDIHQAPDAVEIVTVGKNTTLSQLIQACWRAREIDKGQTILYAVSLDTVKVIQTALSLPPDAPITLHELIEFTFNHAIVEWEKDNGAGGKALALDYLQSLIYDAIKVCRKERISFEKLLVPEVAFLLEHQQPIEARQMYQGEQYTDFAQKILEQEIEKIFTLFANAWQHSPILQQLYDLQEVRDHLNTFIHPEILPETLVARKGSGVTALHKEVEIVKEQQKEQVKELDRDQLVISERETLDPKGWGRYTWRQLNAQDKYDYTRSLRGAFVNSVQAGMSAPLRALRELPSTELTRLISGGICNLHKWWPMDVLVTNLVHDAKSVASAISSYINKLIEPHAYFYPLQEYLETSEDYSKQATVWDSRLQVSINFAPNSAHSPMWPLIKPFGCVQKLSPYVFIRRDVETGEWQCGLLDQTDTENFIAQLSAHRHMPVPHGCEMLLYGLDNMAVIEGPGQLTRESIQSNKDICLLIAQAKFYNGILTHTAPEAAALCEWVQQHGVKKMRRLFESIVSLKEERAQLVSSFDKMIANGLVA